jgi:integrase/recombinase XerD
VSKAIRAAGVTDPRITGHSLRHYLATTLLRDGVSIRVVQEILGHASLATTQLYADVSAEDMQDGITHAPSIAHRKKSGRQSRAVKSETLAA